MRVLNRALPLLAIASLAPGALAEHLSNDALYRVYDVLQDLSTYSWENGTMAQAMLEWVYPRHSVFTSSGNAFPRQGQVSNSDIPSIIQLAQVTMQNRPPTNTSANSRGSTLLDDAAAADPASLGGIVLLANASTAGGVVNGVSYGEAARLQTEFLLYGVPRSSTGAISHRRDQSQYWADFVFMVPPYLAAYAEYTNNRTIMLEAVRQCELYRSFLRREPLGLWAHIQGGQGNQDPGLWATGNAWAAYGMLRVHASISRGQWEGEMGEQQGQLIGWVREIMDGVGQTLTSNNLTRNYMNDTNSFEETSASALFAATGLRLSLENITSTYVPLSLSLLSAVSARVNTTGHLQQVVNPLDWSVAGRDSPEGQAFVLMAYSAWGEWDWRGRDGSRDGSDGLGRVTGGEGRAVGMGLGLGWGLGLGLGAVGLGLGMLI